MPQLREDLGTACENLLTNYDILKCIENHFENSFDAKGFISNVFLVRGFIISYCYLYNISIRMPMKSASNVYMFTFAKILMNYLRSRQMRPGWRS